MAILAIPPPKLKATKVTKPTASGGLLDDQSAVQLAAALDVFDDVDGVSVGDS